MRSLGASPNLQVIVRALPSAEREGNEPILQYVGYQIFDLPVGADSMN